ncbi:hypothetical protein Hdeb2414_s0009g00318921 [Helianthus debilis subsp. tardiflorus]
MVWRFKDQTMSFDLGDDFVFNKELAQTLIENKSPIRPLPEYFLLWGQVCFSWGRENTDWPVIRTKRERNEMSLMDAPKILNFNVLDFDFDEQAEGEVPFMQQVASVAQEIRPLTGQGTSEPSAADATSSVTKPTKGAAGSSGSQAGKRSILDDVDSDLEVRSLDEALKYQTSSGSLKRKCVTSYVKPKGFIRKRKNESLQIRSSGPLPMPNMKKNKKRSSHSSGDVMIEFDEHLSGGKSSREEAARARSAPTPTFSGGFLLVNEAESMEVENPIRRLPMRSLYWNGISGIGIQRWIDLVARTFLFNISTPLDHARSRKMKNQDLGAAVLSNQPQSNIYVTELYRRWVEAESVKENLEKETLSLKRKIQRTPDAEKKLSQLSQDLQAQKEKVKSLTTQNQSSQAAVVSAVEERDKISAELRSFAESSKKKDEEHKEVLSKMEESVSNTRSSYEKTMICNAFKTGEADLRARMDEMKSHHKAEIEELKLENTDLEAKVEDLQATKTWLLSAGAQLLAKNVHRGPEMTATMAAVNNAMSSIRVNTSLHQGYVLALKKKTPYVEVPLLNQNAEADQNTAVSCYESLTFQVVNDLPKLINATLSMIKDALFFAGGESSTE